MCRSIILVFTAISRTKREYFIMPFKFYGLYVPTECSSNDIEMAEDDHVPHNTKCMDLAEDIEATQCF